MRKTNEIAERIKHNFLDVDDDDDDDNDEEYTGVNVLILRRRGEGGLNIVFRVDFNDNGGDDDDDDEKEEQEKFIVLYCSLQIYFSRLG